MSLNPLAPASDAGFARWAAQRAGAALLELRAAMGFDDPAALRAAGDLRAHELLLELVQRWRPGDAVLSEEGVRDEAARAEVDRVWIVDPLDGTREFGEPGRTDWAVHVALWRRSAGGLVAGAVALPARHQVFSTESPPANPVPAPRDGTRPLRLAASRTRPPAWLGGLEELLGPLELVPMGSAGVKICAVVTGEVDAYVHAGGQYEWDSAAPVAVATATGLHASRIDGSALEYNRADPRLPDIVVCHRSLASRLLAALATCA
jgi:3'(2'), 5'-bisphosphate nucleotidase